MKDLSLEFDAGPHSAIRRYGPRVFEIGPDPETGQYGLPRLVLVSGDGAAWSSVHELRIIEIRDAPPELKHWLMTRWTYPEVPGQRILGRRVLEPPVSVPAQLLPPAPDETGGRLSCDVIWGVAFSSGAAAEAAVQRVPFTVTVEFLLAPPGGAPEEPEEELYGLRRRTIPDRDRVFPGFAAVDFGTTACTVTLYDPRQDDKLPIDPEQELLLRSLLADLLDDAAADLPAHVAKDWRTLLDGLPDQVAALAGDERIESVGRLAARLRGGRPLPAGLLDRVCLELDKGLVSSPEKDLAHWLGLRLHDVYDQALDVPPLARVRLRQVVFPEEAAQDNETAAATFVNSGMELAAADPPSFTIGHDLSLGRGVCPDLKRYLGETAQVEVPGLPPDHSLTTDYLYTHVYHELLRWTEKSAAGDRDPEPRPITRLAVTYPTTTPPDARAALRRLLAESLDATDVCVDYDEGVAAGLFFILRDLGMDYGNGAEALRARSHPVPGAERPTWEQSCLVVDIGGGTTDIALLRLTLSARDPEPDAAGPVPDTARGIHYDLSPEVVGSSGHTQLGGNFLTLRVFYWLKARIADALLRGEEHTAERDALAEAYLPATLRAPNGDPLSLTDAVLGHGLEEDVVPADVKHVLDALLPTQWPQDAVDDAARSAFRMLFAWAEDAKRILGRAGGAPGPEGGGAVSYGVDHGHLAEIYRQAFELAGRKAPYGAALLPVDGIRLEPSEFRRLLRPAVHRIASIAADLVADNVDRLPARRLDRVMLSGRSTLMPLVKEGIVEWFTGGVSNSAALPWNAAAISLEARYAKQAASIGAAWAYATKTTEWGAAQPHAADEGGGVLTAEQRGLTEISLTTENLFLGMPCNMELLGAGTFAASLFRTGEPFEELDETGRLGLYSKPFSLPHKIFLQRVTSHSSSITWGSLDVAEHAGREKFRPAESLWWGAGGRPGPRVQARIEVDHQLTPAVHICLGREHFLVRGEAVDLAPLLAGHGTAYGGGRFDVLPWAVHVVTDETEQTTREVFPAGPLGGTEPRQMHESPDPQTPAVPGAVASLPPPLVEDEYPVYRFVAVGPDGTRTALGELRAPGEGGARAAYQASLTATGVLRVHRGRVPFLPAKDLREVQERPGAVRRLAMTRSESSVNEMWNPYSGRH
ncbi:hypothetical protein RKE29_24940 [Streptomyces sp. B1866]|uniref:hypothetical protein n=1 Tax=Streptomyces sp. B1866 TaxID=3075431 RepID=UPI00288E1E08|nr:hypothetical protein [Streptomyces sp. B1866]MDT3399844.1 hypothetical protein [Streptomyces sp. B1866]